MDQADIQSRIDNARLKLNTAKTPEERRAAVTELEELIAERNLTRTAGTRPERGVRG